MFEIRVDEHICIKLLTLKDSEALYRLVDESREHLAEWLPWVNDIQGAKDYDEILPEWIRKFVYNHGFEAGIFNEDTLVGMVRLEINPNHNKASIGYFLNDTYEGRGIVTKTVKRVVNLAFHTYNMNRIEILCAVDNYKSRNIPKKLGFTEEGVLRQNELVNGIYLDYVVYSLLREEWQD